MRIIADFTQPARVIRQVDAREPCVDTRSLHRFGNEVVSMRRLSAGQGNE